MLPDNLPSDTQEIEPRRGLADLCNACDQQLTCPGAYVRCAWLPDPEPRP